MEKNLFQKLCEIRQKISVKKTGFNKFGNYNYYEIDEIYSQAKSLFNEYKIFTTFDLKYDKETEKYRATLTVIDCDNPSSSFTMNIDSPLNEMKASASQQVGSNNTYQSKYLYMDLLMLDDGASDPDKTNTHGQYEKPKYTQQKSYEAKSNKPVSTFNKNEDIEDFI